MTAAPVRPGRREEVGVPPSMRGLVSRLLWAGLLLSAALLVLGLGLYLREGIGLGPSHGSLAGRGVLLAALATGEPAGFVFLGVLVLLVTPLARVALSVGLFASVGDRAFTGLTLFVLVLLAATLAVGVLG